MIGAQKERFRNLQIQGVCGLRLMANSNFVGRSTGMSAGLFPCKIFATNTALRRKTSISRARTPVDHLLRRRIAQPRLWVPTASYSDATRFWRKCGPECSTRNGYASDARFLRVTESRPAGISTTRVSKSACIGASITGASGNLSDGPYHGRLSLTPPSTACAINFPISSPCRGTSFFSASYL